jgi:hypothetical protein
MFEALSPEQISLRAGLLYFHRFAHLPKPTPEQREAMAKFDAIEGGDQTLARLESYLIQMEGTA